MANVIVKKLDALTFEVTVEGATCTIHIVTLPPDYAEKLTAGRISALRLITLSFEFLLAREPNTSILRRFDLPLIASYFPEYEQTISKLL